MRSASAVCRSSTPTTLPACDKAIKEELAANEPSVIISRRPCALLKYVKHPGPIEAKPEKCVGCKACMKLGCPAISVMGGKVPDRQHPPDGCRPVPAAVPQGRAWAIREGGIVMESRNIMIVGVGGQARAARQQAAGQDPA